MSDESPIPQISPTETVIQNITSACVTGAVSEAMTGTGVIGGCVSSSLIQAVLESVKPTVAH